MNIARSLRALLTLGLVAVGVLAVASPASAITYGGQVWNRNSGASILIVSERGTAELWAGATSRQYGHSDVDYVQARPYECIQGKDYGTSTWRKMTSYSGQRVGIGNTARKDIRTVMRTGVC